MASNESITINIKNAPSVISEVEHLLSSISDSYSRIDEIFKQNNGGIWTGTMHDVLMSEIYSKLQKKYDLHRANFKVFVADLRTTVNNHENTDRENSMLVKELDNSNISGITSSKVLSILGADLGLKWSEDAAKSSYYSGFGNLKENYDDGRDVKVVDGVFYIPSGKKSGYDSAKGTGMGGLNAVFAARLSNLFKGAENAGYKVSYTDAFRSYSAQVAAKRNKPKLSATPGNSMHGWGIAADLNYHNSSEARKWVHANAEKYGLKFPISYENWHIEPSERKKY